MIPEISGMTTIIVQAKCGEGKSVVIERSIDGDVFESFRLRDSEVRVIRVYDGIATLIKEDDEK